MLTDRIAMRGNGFWRFWDLDGTWISDVPFPGGVSAGATSSVITGDDVLICASHYSRDYGATWTSASGLAPGNQLAPVRLF